MRNLIYHVVGTRPNFIKAAPLIRSLSDYQVNQKIIHTGQHYTSNLSDSFFNSLSMPNPDFYLEVKSGTHGQQTSRIIERVEKVLLDERPDLVIVYGDVNSTAGAALAASKLNIPVAHVESGLRSFDRTMPEEINRVIVDHISNLHFVSEKSGIDNLKSEGISNSIHFVGNTMIDTLMSHADRDVSSNHHVLMTFHRPSNVDTREGLQRLLKICKSIAFKKVFPIHPRTWSSMKKYNIFDEFISIESLSIIPSQGYIDFLNLMQESVVIITDSGGIQEESTFLKIPCLTLRKNTERPSTIEIGTNTLVDSTEQVINLVDDIFNDRYKKGKIPHLWDGLASKRISNIIVEFLENK